MNNNRLLYKKKGITSPLEYMGKGATFEGNQERIDRRKEEEIARRERLAAIELARQSRAEEQTETGIDRTTEITRPKKTINTVGGGTLFNPATQGMNTAANGADIDYSKVNEKATTDKGWKGLNGTVIGQRITGNGVNQAQSLAHASEVIAPFENNKKAMDALEKYVEIEDRHTKNKMLNFQAGAFSAPNTQYAEEFINQTGVSMSDFQNIVANYSQLKHQKDREQQQQEYADMSHTKRVAKSLVNAPANILGSYWGLIGNLQDTVDPELGRDYNSQFYEWSNRNTDLRNAENEAINKIKNPTLRTVAHFGYNAAVMGVESATAALTGEIGLASFFAGGYNQGLKDAEDRGLSPEESQAYALSIGGLEYITERIPWEGLKKIYAGSGVSKDAVKGSIKPYITALLKQSGAEAAEEVVNGIGETIADGVIAGDKSNLNLSIQRYMQDEGLSEEEATRKAIWDVVKDTADAAITAGLSAGVSAGPALYGQARATTNAGRDIINNSDQISNVNSPYYIANERESYVADEDYQQALNTRQAVFDAAQRAADNQKISGKEARAILEDAYTARRNMSEADRARAIKVREEAISRAEERAVEKVKNASTPVELETIRESSNSDKVAAAVEEKKAQLIEAGKATENDFSNAITPAKASAMAEKGEEISADVLSQLPEEVRQAYETSSAVKANQDTSNVTKTDISTVEYKDSEGKSIYSDIKAVSQNAQGEIVYELENGQTVSQADVEHTPRGRQLYESPNGINSLDNPVLAQIAIDIEKNSSHGVAIGTVTNTLKDMYTLGAAGLDFNQAIKSKDYDVKVLGKEALRAAYEEGKKHSEAKSRSTYAKKGKGLIKEANNENKAAYESQFVKQSNGKTIYDEAARKEYEDNLSKSHKDFLELFSKKIGVDIAFIFDNNTQNRGEYRPDEGKIYLNLAYSHNMFNVALHEGIGEFMAASNEKAYNAIVDSVLNAYAATNSTKLANDIRAYQRAYEGDTYGDSARGASYELFNDALSDMFRSDENMQKLYNWMVENEGKQQAEKVKKTLVDYFKDVAETIKDIRRDGLFSKSENRQLKIAEDQANKYIDQIFKAMDEAIANRDAGNVQQKESASRNSKVIEIENKLASALKSWDGKNARVKFTVGRIVGEIAAKTHRTGNIILDSSKLISIKNDHPEMTNAVLEKLPEIFEDPIVIMDSKNPKFTSRLIVIGELMADNRPVLSVLEMQPNAKGISVEDIKLASAYTKDTRKKLQNLIDTSNVIYINNKKRSNWELRTRLQLPVGISTTSNFIIEEEKDNATTKPAPKSINVEKLNDTVRHSFAGINSETADKEQLKIAQELHKKGMGDLTILETTGWFLGMDNQWKYEIPDNDIEIFKEGNREYVKNNPDFARYLELEDKILFTDSEYTEEEYDELLKLDKIVSSDEYYKTKRYGKLSDYIQHDELFRSYPWMQNVDVMFVPMESDKEKGYADPQDLVIALNIKFQTHAGWNKDALKSTLLHEIQHIIQAQEGFAGGSTPEWWANIRDERIERDKKNIEGAKEHLQKWVDKAAENGNPTSTGEFVTRSVHRIADKNDSYDMEDHWAAVAEWKATSSIYYYENMISKLERHIDRLLSESDIELYFNTAGEIEARDTSNRANWTKEQRLKTFPVQNAKDVVYPKENITNRRYSIQVDTEGRSLSEGQKEYFKDSLIKNEDGKLMVVYHGSPNEFTEFKHDFIGTTGTAEGKGFYFTNNRSFAEGYSRSDDGHVLEGYLDIKKPLSLDEITLTKGELKKFLTKVDPTGDEILSDYDTESGVGYPSKAWYNRALNDTINAFLDFNENDADIAAEIYNMLGKDGLLEFKNILGYDGFIARDKYPDSEVYVAFDSNQFKNVDNENPTSDQDIRKSINVDWDNNITYKLPDRTYEDDIFFLGTDEEIEAAERQDIEAKAYVANIIHSKDFAGLMFTDSIGMQRLLTKSTRAEWDWQLSESRNGEPVGHENYREINDDVTSYDSWPDKTMAALYNEIINELPKTDARIFVIREGLAEKARYSKAVFGEESPYSASIEQKEFVSKVLSTLNNQLKGTTVSVNYINDTVDYILDKYQANLNPDEFRMQLSQFIAYMTANEHIDYDQMMNYLLNIGDEVIQSSNLKDPEEERIYSELKRELSTHKIILSESEKKELIHKYGGNWNAAFGKLNAAGIKLSKNGTHMDGSTYLEIVDRFREIAGIQLDEEITPVDQIATIIDVMDAMKPSAYQWDGATDMDKALDVATTIIDRYYSMATAIKESNIVKGTDKGAAAVERAKKNEIKKLRAKQQEYKAKLNDEFQKLVEDRKKVIEDQQAFYKRQAEIERQFRGEKRAFNKKVNMSAKELEKTAKLQAQLQYQGLKDTEAKRKYKDNIVRTSMRLINWMNKPTDARHVPAFLKPALSEMIKSINFMPASMRKGDDGTISAQKWQTSMRKLQQVLTGLNAQSIESIDDSDKYNLALVLDAEDIVVKMEELLNKYSGTADIAKMSIEDLKTLSDIMTNISTGISKMNENFMNRRFKHVSEAAIAAMDEMDKLKPISDNMNIVKSKAAEILNLDMLDPYSFFHELGDAAKSIMQEFYDGEKIGVEIIREAEGFFDNLVASLNITQKDLRAWENDRKEYHYDGGAITLTPAEIMSLYCSYNREKLDQQERPFEATHHIMSGGIKGHERKIGVGPNATIVNRNPKVLHLKEGEILELINTLTTEQIAYADAVVAYMSNELAAHGNETSNKLNGYSKFLGTKYFPIKTDSNTVKTNESNSETGLAGLMSIIHQSFTKSQLDKADNALVLMNFFDVVTEHVTGMSNYCAYAMPLSDALRWYNYSETERNNTDVEDVYWRETKTVKESMLKVKGKGAKDYFENFLRDVNLDPANKGGSKVVAAAARALTGLGRAKAIALNISVWVQQPTAIVRASDVIEGKYLRQGIIQMLRHPINSAKYAQATNYLCYWKSKGFSDYRVSMGMKEIITGYNTKLQEAQEIAGKPAGIADDITWAAMYFAAENKIKATTDLDTNSQEYRTAVDELFSEIINQTQVIDSTLRTTNTMRSQNDFEYLANAFKKEPQKSYNMLHRAVFNVKQADTPEEKNAADKAFRNTLSVFMLTSLVNGMVVAAVKAWRDDDDENYLIKWLKNLTPYGAYQSIITAFEDGEFTAKEIAPLLRGIWGGMGTAADNADILSAIPLVAEIDSFLKGYSPSTLNYTSILTEANKTINSVFSATSTPYNALYSLSALTDYITGLGVSNAIRDIRGIWNQTTRVTGLPRIEKSTKAEADAKKNKNMDALIRAINNATSDTDKANAKADIYAAVDAIYQYKYDTYINDKENPKTPEEAEKSAKTQTKSSITSQFKPEYKQLVADKRYIEATNLERNLIYAYGRLGYEVSHDDFEDWLK